MFPIKTHTNISNVFLLTLAFFGIFISSNDSTEQGKFISNTNISLDINSKVIFFFLLNDENDSQEVVSKYESSYTNIGILFMDLTITENFHRCYIQDSLLYIPSERFNIIKLRIANDKLFEIDYNELILDFLTNINASIHSFEFYKPENSTPGFRLMFVDGEESGKSSNDPLYGIFGGGNKYKISGQSGPIGFSEVYSKKELSISINISLFFVKLSEYKENKLELRKTSFVSERRIEYKSLNILVKKIKRSKNGVLMIKNYGINMNHLMDEVFTRAERERSYENTSTNELTTCL